MKIILDTNVLVSGLFFKGNPSKIIELWKSKRIELILSVEIFDEYKRISNEFNKRYPSLNLERIFEIIGEKSKPWFRDDFLFTIEKPSWRSCTQRGAMVGFD